MMKSLLTVQGLTKTKQTKKHYIKTYRDKPAITIDTFQSIY